MSDQAIMITKVVGKHADAPIVGAIYRHFKGNLYRVSSVKHMSAVGKLSVLYVPLYESPYDSFDRPIEEWLDLVVEVEYSETTSTSMVVGSPPVSRFALVAKDSQGLDEALKDFAPKTAEMIGPPGSDIKVFYCARSGCEFNGEHITERWKCSMPRCPVPGTPGYRIQALDME